MKLYEFEGHKILTRAGIDSPFFVICQDMEEVDQAIKRLSFPIVVKAQTLSGKRGKRGGVVICKNSKQLYSSCRALLGRKFEGEAVRFIGLFAKVEIVKELYASISYDTVLKIPFMLFSQKGGVDVEEAKADGYQIKRIDINPLNGLVIADLKKITGDRALMDFLLRLWDAFCACDARLVEVNPIAKTKEGYRALDAKLILDDNGLARQRDLDIVAKGSASAIPTKRELAARKIDSEDYRGSAGSTFIEFNGDIAVLASGGGASLLVMDSLADAGGRAANYTEYSGNPPREKVEKLTKIALSRDGLSGCLVAGAVANFTDICETLAGFADGLRQIKPKAGYPIVIRRGGPKQKEAYKMLAKFAKSDGYDIHLFGPETPISMAAKKMVELADQFKKRKFKA